jgi:PPOX class probable F420-dependent enzyme
MSVDEIMSPLVREEYLCITTFKRDGRGVATTLWFVVLEDRIYFRTPLNTGKVKRLRANSDVRFFASDRDGRRIGPTHGGRARVLRSDEDTRLIDKKLRKKYGLIGRAFAFSFHLPGRREAFVVVEPT